jgi:hypothetical protein
MQTTWRGLPMKACKDCRNYRYGWVERLELMGGPSNGARCMAVEAEYDKVTGETNIPVVRCWNMRLRQECGPDAKLWGPF